MNEGCTRTWYFMLKNFERDVSQKTKDFSLAFSPKKRVYVRNGSVRRNEERDECLVFHGRLRYFTNIFHYNWTQSTCIYLSTYNKK